MSNMANSFTEIPLDEKSNRKVVREMSVDEHGEYVGGQFEGVPAVLQPYQPKKRGKYKTSLKHFLPYRKMVGGPQTIPIDEAGCFSFITFSWMSSIMYKLWKRTYKQADLWSCSVYDNSNSNSIRLEHIWNQELSKMGPEKASLGKTVWRFSRTRVLVSQACFLLCLATGFLGPALFVRIILEFAESLGRFYTLGYGIGMVFGLFSCELLRSLAFAATWAVNYRTGNRVRSGVLGLLFRKLLRLQNLGNQSAGQFVNLFANDGIRLFEGMTLGPLIIGGPIIVFLGLGYVVWLVGGWGMMGMAIFLLFYFFQLFISKLAIAFRQKSISITDKRVKLMNEVFTYIKLIKVYAWEKPFAKMAAQLRKSEKVWLQRAAYVQSISLGMTPIVPVAAVIVTFVTHIGAGNDLSVAQAFTVVAIMNTMRFSIAIIPFSVRCLSEMNVAFNRIKAYTAIILFSHVAWGARMISLGPRSIGELFVAIKRFKKILAMQERHLHVSKPSKHNLAIQISSATFAWEAPSLVVEQPPGRKNSKKNKDISEKYITDKKNKQTAAPAETEKLQGKDDVEFKTIRALQNITLDAEKGKLIGICGSVGSGKSSLLSAVLGQMRLCEGTLAIDGKFAYVAQQAWIINASVRDNIVFGAEFDSKRYYEAIHAANLNTDIAMLPSGDETEVGERGINLSGGQKQRISLARALFTNCDIYLLDDPLSSVDPHVGHHIFKYLIRGSLKDKTILFVTHQLQYLNQCDEVILLKDGMIGERGTHAALMASDNEYANLIRTFHSGHKMNDSTEDVSELAEHELRGRTASVSSVGSIGSQHLEQDLVIGDGKLIGEEEHTGGSVQWHVYKGYFQAAGGMLACVLVLFIFAITALSVLFSSIWLSYWLQQGSGGVNITEEVAEGNRTVNVTKPSTNIVDNPKLHFYKTVYGLTLVAMIVFTCLKSLVFMKITLRASSKLHDNVFRKMLRAPMSFFDSTPVGRIINRFSTDMDEVDVRLPYLSEMVLQNLLYIAGTLLIVASVFPYFLIAAVPLAVIFGIMLKCFQNGIRELKRAENISRSPLFSHVTSSVQGLATIHAYNKTEEIIVKFDELLDVHTSAYYILSSAMRWLSVRLDVLTLTATTVTALLCVCLADQYGAAWAGLALTYAMQLSGMFQFTVRLLSETEARFTSVERIQHYTTHITSESPDIIEDNRPDDDWPNKGHIHFSRVNLRYRENLPLVLKDLTFEVKAGEKIGICGRTGAGKSSLGVALFRIVELESGSISIDAVDIGQIGLEDLRSRISIIPQDPVLFAGNVRYNLDPFDNHKDEELWLALEKTHMKDIVTNLENKLAAPVTENGENFSVGERQLICMARALLRSSKILLLDEATAAIDTETDALIQATIKDAFAECTLLTIAHRINTVLDYDKILVMSDGRIAEFDTPANLLVQKRSLFSSMVRAAERQMKSQTSGLSQNE